MSRHRAVALGLVEPTKSAALDWHVERISSLIEYRFLEDEWDPERLLLVPRPGGHLTRVPPCRVAGCPNVCHGAKPLCSSHLRQFGRSSADDLEGWLAGGEPHPVRRRHSDETCVVTDTTGGRCLRPAVGVLGLCHAHGQLWADQGEESSFEEFLLRARPMPGFGPCAAACCYLAAAHRESRLCSAHYTMWAGDGRPAGRAFEIWAATASQPANGRVLSLRGLPELVRLELLYAIGCRVREQIRTAPWNMRAYVDRLRATGVGSILEFDPALFDAEGTQDYGRFSRFAADRVGLAYGDVDSERAGSVWDLRHFGRSGRLDFSGIAQEWLREATKSWAAASLANRNHQMVRSRVHAIAVMSNILSDGPGGGQDPSRLSRSAVDRFLVRVRSAVSPLNGRPYSPRRTSTIIEDCAFVLRDARDMGLLGTLAPTFAIRRGDAGRLTADDEPGRALPAQVVAQLDAQIDLLRTVPGSKGGPAHRSLGVLGDRAGEMAVLSYLLLKGTGRRVGEVAGLHLECLDTDEQGKAVLVYDNRKAMRLGRRLPLADSALVEAIRDQQSWVRSRFSGTSAETLWLLPRGTKNLTGTAHLPAHQILMWMRAWVEKIPVISAGGLDAAGEQIPFERSQIHPHAFRHTYAQTLADQGVPAPVLRDLMDHRSIDTTLGYFSVSEKKKRAAMELLARHTVDNRGTVRPVEGERSRAAELRDHLSWVAVPMGKCAEPNNVKAGGGACPIRYQCAGCPHFETDPSYLPELRAYADQLRAEREAMIAAGAAEWVVGNVSGQLEVVVGHIRHHEALLGRLAAPERALIEQASVAVRKARQGVPVAFGRRR